MNEYEYLQTLIIVYKWTHLLGTFSCLVLPQLVNRPIKNWGGILLETLYSNHRNLYKIFFLFQIAKYSTGIMSLDNFLASTMYLFSPNVTCSHGKIISTLDSKPFYAECRCWHKIHLYQAQSYYPLLQNISFTQRINFGTSKTIRISEVKETLILSQV